MAPTTGKYIFTVADDNADASYYFYVIDDRGEKLCASGFSASGEKKVSLEAEQSYSIIMKYREGYANYTVNISY